jgi:hypothetical protein
VFTTSLQQLFQQHKTNNDLFISKLMNGGANEGTTNKHGGDTMFQSTYLLRKRAIINAQAI